MVKVLSVNGKIPLVDGKAIEAQDYGGSTIELDTTLTQSGKAADAKAVGDALAGKQDAINDLEAIRTGAAKGATALQSVPSTYRTAAAQDVIDSSKVDKVTGKGLSTNDYTNAAKAKVDALASVATSGNYNDLTNKPTIPTVLPNPNALTFTGAVTGSYDGSEPLTVEMPSIPKPLTYDYMPEGYPKKSVSFNMEWAGNTAGLAVVEDGYGGRWYKVSDLVVDPSVFASGATLTYAGGRTDFMSIDAATGKNLITIEPGMVAFGKGQVMIFTETPEAPYEAFEIGVYFESDEIYDVRKVTGGGVITPMAEEFLPNIPADKLPASGVTTLHINVTAVNLDAMMVTTSTADKTPAEMEQASLNGPIWCVVTFAAGIMSEEAVSIGIPPAYLGGGVAFGMMVATDHDTDGTNAIMYTVTPGDTINPWSVDLRGFGS